MADGTGGDFSKNFFTLQLQLQTLLEGAGGEAVVKFLDRLSELNPSEQRIALTLFSRAVEELKAGDQRLVTAQDLELKRFEDELLKGITTAFAEHGGQCRQRVELQVYDGGKTPPPPNPILDLAAARKRKRSSIRQ